MPLKQLFQPGADIRLGVTVCVTGRWAGVDNVWVQRKLEARKMPENGDESHLSSAPQKIAGDHFIRENGGLRSENALLAGFCCARLIA